MALLLFCQMMLVAFVSCQTQNSTDQDISDQSNVQNITYPYTETNQLGTYEDNIIDNETSTTPVVETSITDGLGIDQGDGGKAEDLADYFRKKVGELLGGGEGGEEHKEVDATTPSEADLQNCSLPTILDRFCEGVPDNVHAYFNYDVSLPGMLASLFKTDVVEALQTNCKPGNWCLSDIFHRDVIETKNRFYSESPFCSAAMLTCMTTMQNKRSSCGEEELGFLVNSIVLLCDLQGIGYLSQECYGRTLETLYVTYTDLKNSSGSQKLSLEQADCNDFKVQMTKTYLCADDVCSFDQNLLLEKFQSWVGIAQKAADVATTCNISRTCQNDYISDVYDETSYGYYDNYNTDSYDNYNTESYDSDDTNNYYSDNGNSENYDSVENDDKEKTTYEDILKEFEDEIKEEELENEPKLTEDEESESHDESGSYGSDQAGNENAINADSSDGYDEQDRSMMVGLIVLTTGVLLGFLCLAFAVYRRFKRARNGNYKWGYSQLTNEDARVVHNDYK